MIESLIAKSLRGLCPALLALFAALAPADAQQFGAPPAASRNPMCVRLEGQLTALDRGNAASTLTVDQRGFTRPADGEGNGTAVIDIGAFEEQTAQPVDLTIAQSAPSTVNIGDTLTYTLTVTNTGASDLTSAIQADFAVPSGTSYGSNTASNGFSASYDSATNVVHFSNGTLTHGSSATLTVTVTPAGLGTVTNNGSSVVVDPADTLAESNETNNTATTVTTTIVSPAMVSGTKTVSGTFDPASTVTYTVVLSNSGPAAQLDNPGNEFTDVLPSGLSLVSASASSGSAVATVGTNTATWNGTIASSGWVTITIQATINNAAAGTTITNQGSIAYDADGNGSNEASALTDDPNVSGANNPTSFVAHRAPAITSANKSTFKVGTPGSFTVTTTGVPTGASMSINQSGTLPAGVTFMNNNNGTGTLAGTPNANTGGVYPITITASNGTAPNATQDFTLTVGQPPVITSANTITFETDTAGSFSVTTTGFLSGASMSITENGALPQGVTFVNNNNGTATLAGTPVTGTAGSYRFTIGANNAMTPSANQAFTLVVTGSGPSPTPSPTPTATATATPTATATATPTATQQPPQLQQQRRVSAQQLQRVPVPHLRQVLLQPPLRL